MQHSPIVSEAVQICNINNSTLPLSRSHFDLGFLGSKDSPPDIPILVEPYPLGGGPWWRFVDAHTGRPFAGRFSGAEVDYLVRFFKTWHGPVGLIDFGAAAARAIEVCYTEIQEVAA